MSSPDSSRRPEDSTSGDFRENRTASRGETEAEISARIEASRREGEGRTADDPQKVEEARRKAEFRAKPTEQKMRFRPGENRADGAPVQVEFLTLDNQWLKLQDIFAPNGSDIEIVYGSALDVDPKTNRVTVPRNLAPAEFPFLFREFVRAMNRKRTVRQEGKEVLLGSADYGAVIDEELKTRQKWEETMDTISGSVRLLNFAKIRVDYKEAEEKHSKTVLKAEEAVDVLTEAAEVSFLHQTGQSIYDHVTPAQFREAVHGALLEKQAELIYPYDGKGNRYYFGTPADDAQTLRELSVFEGFARFASETDTVRDFRLHKRLLIRGEEKMTLLPFTGAALTGKAALFTLGVLGVKLFIDVPKAGLLAAYHWLDDTLFGWQKQFGEMVFGKGYAPKRKPERELHKKRKEELEKAIHEKMSVVK